MSMRLTPTRAFFTTTCLTILPTYAAAQNVLTPIDPPAERPYPYEILGIQPGDSLDDVMAVFASRSDEEPTAAIRQVRTNDDLTAALTRIDVLWGAKHASPEGDELDFLVDLVEQYETEHARNSDPDPEPPT